MAILAFLPVSPLLTDPHRPRCSPWWYQKQNHTQRMDKEEFFANRKLLTNPIDSLFLSINTHHNFIIIQYYLVPKRPEDEKKTRWIPCPC